MVNPGFSLNSLINDLAGWRKPIPTDALLEKYKGTDKESKMRTIFEHFDLVDSAGNSDGVKRDNYVSNSLISELCNYFNPKDNVIEQKAIDEYASLKSANVTANDMNEAFTTLVEFVNNQKAEEPVKGPISSEKVKINNITYTKETTQDEDQGYTRESYHDENGVLQFVKKVYNDKNSREAEITETFDEDFQVTTITTKYRNGVTEFIDCKNNTSQVKLNDNAYNTENESISNITLNKNNEVLALDIKPVYDEYYYKVTDIKMSNKNNLPIEFPEKEKFLELLNNVEYTLFKDFQLKVTFENGNQVVLLQGSNKLLEK